MIISRKICKQYQCKDAEIDFCYLQYWFVSTFQLDSPYDMARPYDLLSFLNQEKRWDSIFDLLNDLEIRQIEIDKLWSDVGRYTDVGRQIAQDDDCLKAGNVNIIDWYAALLEDGSNKIHPNEFLLPNPYYGPNNDIPDCKKISSLTFSMFAFEHLTVSN